MAAGKQTTEFWLVLAYGLMVLANGTDFINVPGDQMTVLAGIFATYTGGRSWVKASEKKE